MAIYNPHIMTNTNGTEHNSDLRSELFEKKRVIFIDNEINSDLATSIITQMMYLNEQSSDDIYLIIDSQGGSVSAGYRIYDYVKYACRCDVVTIVNGMAASMGAFLLSSGTIGKRYALPNSDIMIHQPLGGAEGQASDIKIVADRIILLRKRLNKILSKNSSQPLRKIEKDTERDCYLDAKEALDYGLIDKVIEKEKV